MAFPPTTAGHAPAYGAAHVKKKRDGDASGWAVMDTGGMVNSQTVSSTRRGAQVNWLCLHGVVVYATATDQQIESAWQQLCQGADVVEVTIRRAAS